MKTCSKCRASKPSSEFYIDRALGGPASQCKECARAHASAWGKANAAKKGEARRRWYERNRESEKSRVREWNAKNRDKIRANKRIYYAKNGGAARARMRERNLVASFGISIAQYDEMYRAQNGVCAICSAVNLNGKRLAVDHCHTTGAIRGLLCSKCNLGIGSFQDSPEILTNAWTYLMKHRRKEAVK